MNIAFVHQIPDCQFLPIHNFINQMKDHQSFLFYDSRFSQSTDIVNSREFHKKISLKKGISNTVYFSELEDLSLVCDSYIDPLKKLHKEVKLDVIVNHARIAPAYFLYNEINVPVITYNEFPSYIQHGWDEKYPPTNYQKRLEVFQELSSIYQLENSVCTIVPTGYAKSLFPQSFQHKIKVQIEGFNRDNEISSESIINTDKDLKYIGFTAHGLSSAKGFERFIEISMELLKSRNDIHFVIVGDSDSSRMYGFESNFIAETNNRYSTFKDYVIEKYDVDDSKFTFLDSLPHNKYLKYINQMDLFLYPLQFGSGTWGLFEILLQEKPIIASNNCFIPEFIEDGVNGYLCNYEDINSWIEKTNHVLNNLDNKDSLLDRKRMSEINESISIEKVSEGYLNIFQEVVK